MSLIEDLNRQAVNFQMAGHHDAAQRCYTDALHLDADNAPALINLAGCCYKLQKYEMGVVAARRAIAIDPTDIMGWNNLAVNLIVLGKLDETQTVLDEAIRRQPKAGTLWHTQGNLFYCREQFFAAEVAFQKARDLGFDGVEAKTDQALAIMCQPGRVVEGLGLYEARWDYIFKSPAWSLGIPEWRGENLDGKHILVHHEQGLGDSLMLVRFVRNLKKLGATVTIATHRALVRLFEENFPGERVVDGLADPTGIDFHSPMLSLMRHLQIEVSDVSPAPYLDAQEPLLYGLPGELKVGLCWSSGEHSKEFEAKRRKVPFRHFAPLFEIPGVQVVSLQKGSATKELVDFGAEPLTIDVIDRAVDLYDTARIIRDLDVVISVDSAVAHLAGAMGKRVLMMAAFPRCWRWQQIPTGMPWYQNVRVFQQDTDLTWDATVSRLLSYFNEENFR